MLLHKREITQSMCTTSCKAHGPMHTAYMHAIDVSRMITDRRKVRRRAGMLQQLN